MNQHKNCLLWIFLLALSISAQAQIAVRYPVAQKATYEKGDTVRLTLHLLSRPETCLDGMKKTKIYLSGLTALQQTDWIKTGTAQFRKTMLLEVDSKVKGKACLTILRKVDKENLFHQEFFQCK